MRKIGVELFNTEKAEAQPLTPKKKRFMKMLKIVVFVKNFLIIRTKSKYYRNFKKGTAHSICKFKYTTQRDTPVVIHNGSNYDFHLIIKELAEEFREEIHCIHEDREKYKSFSMPLV